MAESDHPVYPEHEKLHAVVDKSQAIGNFLDNSDYTLCEFVEGHGEGVEWTPAGYYPVLKPLNEILADWFGIDLQVLEEEKRAMLDRQREANATHH